MERLKDLDFKILFELMRNSKRSDRELAREIGVSQPTVTRRRIKLEKNVIDGYTAIPNWKNIGFKIMAITLVSIKHGIAVKERYMKVRERGLKWLNNQPNVIMASGCRGADVDSMMISIHKTYGEYDMFMRDHMLEMGDLVENVKSIIINLAGEEVLKPLHLRYLTEL